jgi:hypothetical protein
MTFLGKIKPHLISDDLLVQETVLHALHDFPNVPEEWTIKLMKEAFSNKVKQAAILIYIENQTINEEAVQILIENIPLMDESNIHLALNLLNRVEPELALKYSEPLQRYFTEDTWQLYQLFVNGTEEEVYTEYGKTLNALESADSYHHDTYIKAKKLAACIVKQGWVRQDEIDMLIQEELKEEWVSFNGILAVYMIGLLKLEKHIPFLASLLVRDDDILLEEVAAALIHFQTDEVVEEVGPYLKNPDSNIFASSIIENIKSDLAVQVLIEAYHAAEEMDEQDLLIEALCYQLTKEGLPEITDHMQKGDFSGLVDMEMAVYSYYSIIGELHPDLDKWKQVALGMENPHENSSMQEDVIQIGTILKENKNKVGRNVSCPCGSGKKYKKCCGK